MSNWKQWKVWQYVGMAAFGILLVFLYFTNRKGFNDMREQVSDKFNKKEDDLEQEQKNDKIAEAKDNAASIDEAEDNIQKIAADYEQKLQEKAKGESTDEKVDDFNDFMGSRK